MKVNTDVILQQQKTLASQAVITHGSIHTIEEQMVIDYTSSIKDYDLKAKRSFKNKLLVNNFQDLKPIQLGMTENKDNMYVLEDEEKNIKVIFYNLNENKDKEAWIEIYVDDRMINRINLIEYHDHFPNFEMFGKPQLNKDNQLFYLAQKNKDKNFYDQLDYSYKPSYGESITNINYLQLFCLNLNNLLRVDNYHNKEIVKDSIKNIIIEENYGQPIEVQCHPKDNNLLMLTLFKTLPYPAGYVYCNNRPKTIYFYNVTNSQLELISDPESSCFNPIVIEDKLYYLKCSLGGAHNHANGIIEYNLISKQERVIHSINNESIEYKQFPGIYTAGFINNPMLEFNNNKYLLLNSQWNGFKVIIAVNLNTLKIKLLSQDINNTEFSYKILDHNNQYLLASRTNPKVSSELVLGKLSANGDNIQVEWKTLNKIQEDNKLNTIEWEIINVRQESSSPLECILIKNKSNKDNKLLLNLHGGPHGSNSVEWNVLNAHILVNGYDILHVNYSGSIGYGQHFIDSLVGKIGDLDVLDCQLAVETIKRRYDYSTISIMGGSHGGFLTAHLIGKYNSFYNKAIMRNPVINLAYNFSVTDIPDWCCYESGLQYNFNKLELINHHQFELLNDKSPLKWVKDLKTKTLMLIGNADQRVPPSQSFLYFKYVKSYSPDLIDLQLFPETGHPLDTCHAEMISIFKILEHLE